MGNEMKLKEFSPPAELQDFSLTNQKKWSEQYISQWIDDEIKGDIFNRAQLHQFFNGTKTAYDQSQEGVAITWTAFPKKVLKNHGQDDQRWLTADSSREVQDEYLEWSVERNGTDLTTSKVRRVVMTCEGPEYWGFLGTVQPEDIVRLYQDLNPQFRSQITREDLFTTNAMDSERKQYNPTNRWNSSTTSGTIAHLIQRNNTLSAEVDIAAQATVLRKDSNDKLITNPDQLIRCSGYGDPDRNSDPHIGSAINSLARGKSVISIANPIGLYIHDFQESVFKLDYNGRDGDEQDLRDLPEGTITWSRGHKEKKQGLHIHIEVPRGIVGNNNQELTVGDIWDTDRERYIQYGAQFADYIKMGVTGVVAKETVTVDPEPCIFASHAPAIAAISLR
ncbi:hypothetical protein Asppvi_003764 [Aspergillus pseudoviridinutans]|uniref:Uncharacterized protein n=1 Tax=Aspergillus pseudoviridinutans TaxID=1517512 RepID=A0A9P3B912_9EURO|nr:uncharacterized protein Asppvi_003764 [Aspergillus pseudoviridinutans]GIJ84913.1 hypothetical protein Asppvi_003764 [Aspergillus pseudoviridinutans]